MANFCSQCGAKVAGEAKFCPACGAQISVRLEKSVKDVQSSEQKAERISLPAAERKVFSEPVVYKMMRFNSYGVQKPLKITLQDHHVVIWQRMRVWLFYWGSADVQELDIYRIAKVQIERTWNKLMLIVLSLVAIVIILAGPGVIKLSWIALLFFFGLHMEHVRFIMQDGSSLSVKSISSGCLDGFVERLQYINPEIQKI